MSKTRSAGHAVLVVGLALAAAGIVPAHGAVITYYGFDPGAVGGLHPNSDAARAAFVSELAPATVGVEDFEGDPLGSFRGGSRPLAFPPTTVGGTVQGLATVQASIEGLVPGYNHAVFNTAGNSSFFEITLDTPRDAFGFYGFDFSDYQGSPGGPYPPIQLTLDGGTPIDVLNVDPAAIPSDSVTFFGVIAETAFTTIRLINPPGTSSEGVGLDDLTVGQVKAVAEPSSWLLLGIAPGAVIGFRLRRGRHVR